MLGNKLNKEGEILIYWNQQNIDEKIIKNTNKCNENPVFMDLKI